MLTGGAVLLGAAVVGGTAGEAEAANGSPVLAGRTTTAGALTKLASTGPGLNVTATGGLGAYVESSVDHGASIWTRHKDKYAAVSVHAATAKGSGAAFRADGRLNAGVIATTSNVAAQAVVARNLGATTASKDAVAVVGTVGPTAQAQLDQAPVFAAAGEFAGATGVTGVATMQSGSGVAGVAKHPYGSGLFSWSDTSKTGCLAVLAYGHSRFVGDVQVTGILSKSGGSFRIDHPLDPENKYLSHSFVESPDMKNIYDGVATADDNGAATVELPEWFEALNKDFRYQLTPIGPTDRQVYVSAELSGGTFALAGARPGQRVCWQVTGIRQDAWANANRIPVEHAKPAEEKGTFLFPEGFGHPPAAGTFARQAGQARRGQ
jgi:hypothetical protein